MPQQKQHKIPEQLAIPEKVTSIILSKKASKQIQETAEPR